MNYDEDLLVELIAGGDVSQTEIAERVGVSRRTVWRIANGHSRPDLQQKIADTVEGYRQATIRLAVKFMKPLLKKQVEVALEGDGETSRKCREFLLKTFMIVLPEQAAKAAEKRKPSRAGDPSTGLRAGKGREKIAPGMSLTELSPNLKEQVVEELGGPAEERLSTTACPERAERVEGISTDVEKATVLVSPLSPALSEVEGSPTVPPEADPLPTARPLDKRKEVADPFAAWVDGPHGEKVYAHAIRAIAEAKAEEAARPTRRRVPRVPRE